MPTLDDLPGTTDPVSISRRRIDSERDVSASALSHPGSGAGELSQREFDRIVEAAYSPLLALAERMIGRNDAADAVQDTMVAACRARGQLITQSDAGLYRWMQGTLGNICKDRLRRHTRFRASSWEALGRDARDTAEAHLASLASDEQRDAACRAERAHEARVRLRYADLTEEERRIIVARLDGVTLSALARRLSMPLPTVHRRLRAAIAKLRACPVRGLGSPDGDHYVWLIGSQVTIYRAPQKTGLGLSRLQLKRLR